MFTAALNFPVMDHIRQNNIPERPLGNADLCVLVFGTVTPSILSQNSNNMDVPLDKHDANNSGT